jgi:hypothetical protein
MVAKVTRRSRVADISFHWNPYAVAKGNARSRGPLGVADGRKVTQWFELTGTLRSPSSCLLPVLAFSLFRSLPPPSRDGGPSKLRQKLVENSVELDIPVVRHILVRLAQFC